MNASYSLKPLLRVDKIKKDGSCPVHFRICFSGNQLKVPAGISVSESNWDKLKRECNKGDMIIIIRMLYLEN